MGRPKRTLLPLGLGDRGDCEVHGTLLDPSKAAVVMGSPCKKEAGPQTIQEPSFNDGSFHSSGYAQQVCLKVLGHIHTHTNFPSLAKRFITVQQLFVVSIQMVLLHMVLKLHLGLCLRQKSGPGPEAKNTSQLLMLLFELFDVFPRRKSRFVRPCN